MATFNKINTFTKNMAEKVHNLASDVLKVALTNTAPVATNTVLASLTGVLATTNLSGATPFNIAITSSTQTTGTYKLILADLVLTATGVVGPFRYIALYNSTATNSELIGWYDYASSVTLGSGDTFTIDFDGINGVLTNA